MVEQKENFSEMMKSQTRELEKALERKTEIRDIDNLIKSKLDFHQVAEQFVQHHQLEETRQLVDALMQKISGKMNEENFNKFNSNLEEKINELEFNITQKPNKDEIKAIQKSISGLVVSSELDEALKN